MEEGFAAEPTGNNHATSITRDDLAACALDEKLSNAPKSADGSRLTMACIFSEDRATRVWLRLWQS